MREWRRCRRSPLPRRSSCPATTSRSPRGRSALRSSPACRRRAFGLLIAVSVPAVRTLRWTRRWKRHSRERAEAGRLVDCMLPKNAAEERDLWRVREDWAVDRKYPGGLWYDVSVPIDRLAHYLALTSNRA